MSSTNNILKTLLRSIVLDVKFGELIPGCRWGNEHVTFRFQSVFDIIFINKRLSHSEVAIFFYAVTLSGEDRSNKRSVA